MKSIVKRLLCLAMAATFGATPVLGNLQLTEDSVSVVASLFTDVTGKIDLSGIAANNFASSVMTNTASGKTRTVIVSFERDNLVDAADGGDVSEYISSAAGQKAVRNIRAGQDEFLSKLSAQGIAYTLDNRYVAVDNAVAITVDTAYISAIKSIFGVASVCVSETYAYPETVESSYSIDDASNSDAALTRAAATVNKTSVYATGVYDSSDALAEGYTGDGSVVAIIDTGLDYTHQAFALNDLYPINNPVYEEEDIQRALNNSDNKLQAEKLSESNGKKISSKDVYLSKKVPFAYDYADKDTDVYPSYSNHGTHVAGIVAGYDPSGYTDKDGKHVEEPFIGVAPAAQLVICKVFSDDMDASDAGGADTEDILAALEDCVILGVDVINMSLGTSCGFSTTDDGDEEGAMLSKVYGSVGKAGISLVCAASNDYSSGYGGTYGTNLASNPDSGTVGSPAVFSSSLAVASISGKKSPYMIVNGEYPVYYEESNDQYSKSYNFAEELLNGASNKEFKFVAVPGVGRASDYSVSIQNTLKNNDAIVLVQRGDNTFKEKVEIASSFGAVGIIVYNNVAGAIKMSLGDVKENVRIPAVSITMDAGKKMVEYAEASGKRTGVVTIDSSLLAGPFMSDFSSWGSTPDLKLKPEVTAHGGEITSTVPGGYGEQSGTSMASPNMAGVVSIVRSYLKNDETLKNDPVKLNERVNQLVMSTATIVYDRDGLPYSPRKQGAGLGSLANSLKSQVYLFTDDESIDYRPNVNLGDDDNKVGEYNVSFKIKNASTTNEYSFELNPIFMTEQLASDGLAVAEQAHMLTDNVPVWSVVGEGATKNGNVLTIAAGAEATINVTFKLSQQEKDYIDESFVNGMFVEGFVALTSTNSEQCDLSLPFMGFYGDWSQAPMLDYSAYEIDASLQDTSIDDEDKLQTSVWATQPYTTYYNDLYSMPMGSFAYLQDEDADRVYTVEEHNAVSCYNVFYQEDDGRNYLTAYQFRGLYVGLLRGARTVKYALRNAETGELIYENEDYRIYKAYTGGGTGRPAFVEFEIPPLENGLVSNGKYTMDFEFFLDGNDTGEPDSTYSFSFYADYEAPVLQDVRVRYNDYKDGKVTKQRIYLDIDVFDNHYAQSALLCYYDGDELKQVTSYVTPIYNSVMNAKNTVSIDITDIYDSYKDKLYLQLDDYALNHSVYYLNLSAASERTTPEDFELSDGEENLTLGIYETHTVSLDYSGSANLSNFTWSSSNKTVADVKNGEVVGLKAGKAKITVSNGSGVYKTIDVAVTDDRSVSLSVPSLKFGTLANCDDKLVSSSSSISLYPDQDVTLVVETDPWYYPKNKLNFEWTSSSPDVVEVDDNGKITMKKEGTAVIKAKLLSESGEETAYAASIMINVLDPFVISDYTLKEYRGTDKTVVIPDDKMILYIGEDAFKDNSTMEEVIIPKTVMNISEQAFYNCSALKSVYFVSKEKQAIADADVSLIYRYSFYNCTSLELVDLTNVKVVTVGAYAFGGCSKLNTIRKMEAIGTANDGAFTGCTSLTSIDLIGMHVAGTSVFQGCTSLRSVTTGEYTAIGDYMFKNCTALASIELNNSVIGNGAFEGCKKLSSVKFNQNKTEFVIGANAFKQSGLSKVTYVDGCKVRTVGDMAFANTKLTSFTVADGLTEWGANVFVGSSVKNVYLPSTFSFDTLKLAGTMFNGATVNFASDAPYKIVDEAVYSANDKILYSVFGNVATFDVPSTVEVINDYAFENSAIGTVNVPSSVKRIGVGAFKNSKLSKIVFAEGSHIKSIPEEAFFGSKLTAISLPSGVTEIGSYAFAKTSLGEIAITDKVTTIGSYAFAECYSLKNVVVPASVADIGSCAFYACTALTEIEIPAVETMGYCVFCDARSLVKVTFGKDAETVGVGSYTIGTSTLDEDAITIGNMGTFRGATALETVIIGGKTDVISSYVFSGCSSLQRVELGNVTKIEEYAFANCVSLSEIDLSKVETVGDYAFYACAEIENLNLTSAETIGVAAFTVNGIKSGATELTLSKAVSIGDMAFYGLGATTVTLPSTLTDLGYGVFAYADNITAFTVENGSAYLFTEGGVLYKKTPNGGYELAAFPAAKTVENNSYGVIEQTVRIDDYAFAGLKDAVVADEARLTKVTLPHTLTNIGDHAFYDSGITEYTFESINAPVLEAVYNTESETIQEEYLNSSSPMEDPTINSYYYANFNTLFVNYIPKTGKTSDLVMRYPTNGVGYDNFVYSRYFGVKEQTGIIMDDTTRGFIEAVEAFVTEDVIDKWICYAEKGDITTYFDEVQKFADDVKEARRLYGNVKDDAQKAFIDEAYVTLLETMENRMRTVKPLYGVIVRIQYLTYTDGSYKRNYTEGEVFDMTGLEVVIVYDDGSKEIAETDKLTLITDSALATYNKRVTVRYDLGNGEYKDVSVVVSVKKAGTQNPVEPEKPDDGNDINDKTDEGGKSLVLPIVIGAVAVVVVAGGAVALVLVKKRKSSTQKDAKFNEKDGEDNE